MSAARAVAGQCINQSPYEESALTCYMRRLDFKMTYYCRILGGAIIRGALSELLGVNIAKAADVSMHYGPPNHFVVCAHPPQRPMKQSVFFISV